LDKTSAEEQVCLRERERSLLHQRDGGGDDRVDNDEDDDDNVMTILMMMLQKRIGLPIHIDK
jgi:hypothetical protein